MFGEALTPPMARDLLDIARDWGPDLLVHEHAELAAPLVGAVLGVPSVTHSFGTAVPVAILDDTAARLAPLWREHGLDVPPYAGCFRAGYLDICPPSVQTMPVDHIPASSRCGRCPRRVRRRRRRGTRSSTSPWAPSRTVPSCCARWSAGVAALPVQVLVAVGPRVEPASLGEQPTHVRVESWVDQAEVLSPVHGRRLARWLGHLPGRPGARAAPALPAAGGRPVPQRRGRDPGGRRARPGAC